MMGLLIALDTIILIAVLLLVKEALKPKSKTTITGLPTNPNGFFKKPKRKPIALDDDAAYELEQKNKRGPQP